VFYIQVAYKSKTADQLSFSIASQYYEVFQGGTHYMAQITKAGLPSRGDQQDDPNALYDLGYKIFLDRYAQKDMTRSTLTVGDTVIVVVDSKTGQREVGNITAMALPEITIELLDGTVVTRDLEHVDKPIETNPGQMMDRVARGIAAIEAEPKQAEWQRNFRWLLEGWKFVPGGRILTGAGTDQNLTYYNCYVIPSPKDSRGGIIETLHQMTEIMSRGGGVGINISTLRPRQSYVKGVNGRSSGSVSWGALYSFVTGLIEQGGSRRGALMLILNDWHPDVFDFINSKRKAGNITNANISVGVSDKLMEAVKADGDWELLFPDTSYDDYDEVWDGDLDKWQAMGRRVQPYKTVKAREVWNAIIESAWASAEPGVWFRERSNKMANSWYFNPLISTNPCGEQPLGAFSVCNLGAINLARFYDADANDVAWDDLARTTQYAIRFLDNVIDSTPYFFEQNAQVQGNERRVGLGTMGIAELMIKLGVRYGSDESVEFIEKLYKFIAVEAYKTSSDVATEKGSFPAFDAEKFLQSGFMQVMPDDVREKIRRDGIRNVTLLTQAPTGTTGTLVNTSTGIEPFFSWVYYRKSRLGLHEEQVPLVKAWRDAHPNEESLPEHFVTAMDLAPEEHVKVQAAFQRWIDSAISKTCNVPNDYTVEQVSKLYEMMYDLGCKGGTIYRDGSRDEQVLMLKDDKKTEAKVEEKVAEAKPVQVATPHRVYPRPKKLMGTTVTCATPFGTAYITMNSDEHGYPFEVFITAPGKAGSDLQADAEGLGRMISLSLRTTDPHNRPTMLRLIIDQLRDIGGARSIGFGETRVVSLPDAVARAMEEYYFKSETPQQLGLPMDNSHSHDDHDHSTPATPVAVQPALALGYSNGTNGSNGSAAPSNGNGFHAGVLSGADVCPSCANITLIRTEGCRKCLTCGYSEC
jgi:ribonucleoside-diphosphate reductase alpha chain